MVDRNDNKYPILAFEIDINTGKQQPIEVRGAIKLLLAIPDIVIVYYPNEPVNVLVDIQ